MTWRVVVNMWSVALAILFLIALNLITMVGDVEKHARFNRKVRNKKMHIIEIGTSFIKYKLRITPVILLSLILHTLEPSGRSVSNF